MAERLKGYRSKRDFDRTPEPAPKGSRAKGPRPKAGAAPRFVVHEHHARRLHWDLRLEHDGVLVSWAIPNGIPEDPKRNRKAIHTEDHPLSYFDFEGTIPEGEYGAGEVHIWDTGTYEAEKFRDDEVIATFSGERLRGRYALFQTGGRDWMIHRMDPPQDPEAEALPSDLQPMMARLAEDPPAGEGWAHEIKWDGVRALAYWEPGRWRMESRNRKDITPRYPELRPLGRELGSRPAVLDGEVVAFDEEGRPSFERLQSRMHLTGEAAVRRRAAQAPVTYVLFDLLFLDGHPLLDETYERRRELLVELALDGPAWRTPVHHVGDGGALLAASREQGLEGIVSKRLDSRYETGHRASSWRKVKNARRQEVVVGGWVPGEGRRRERIGALLVGVNEPEGLRYSGRVGTGFTEHELDRLAGVLGPLERPESPFLPVKARGRSGIPRTAVFVSPEVVADVDFGEWTREGMLRHPSYKGQRTDKEASEVVREEPGDDAAEATEPSAKPAGARQARRAADPEVEVEGRRLKLSNLDKVLYPQPGFTKGDVIDYYARIGPVVLSHLKDRPLTLKRYPDGVEAKPFYEKQVPSHAPEWVQTARVYSRSNRRDIDFVLAQDLPTLVWLANLADLELHPSLAQAPEVHQPTMVVFDLDPGAPAGLIECARVGLRLRDLFAELGLKTVIKTSGSKGMQAYVPLNTEVTYEQTRPFAKAVADLLAKHDPGLVVSQMAKDLRKGRVFVDWSQNAEHKTTVGVYSLRAMERPTVSTPVTWDEVEAAHEAQDPSLLTFEAGEVLERVDADGDLFAPALSLRQRLPDL